MSITLTEIAALAGVSRGTVYRALNNTGRIKAEVAERIRIIAKEQGYKANRAGKLLTYAKRPLKIGVIVQNTATPFIKILVQELFEVQKTVALQGIKLIIEQLESMDADKQIKQIDALMTQNISGLALTPTADKNLSKKIDEIAKKIPVITFNTDLPGSKRLCYVGQNNYLSGRACGSLMGILLNGQGEVLMITGNISNLSHQKRVAGFIEEINNEYPKITLLPVEIGRDQDEIVYQIVKKHLQTSPNLSGIYLSANGQASVGQALEELGTKRKIKYICHDLFKESIEKLKSGTIDFIIGQDARTQAQKPIEILMDYLVFDEKPSKSKFYTLIDIRNKYNV